MKVVTILVLLFSPVLATCFGDLWGNVWVDTTRRTFHPGDRIPVGAYFAGYNGHEPAYNYTVCVKLIKGIPTGMVRGGTCKTGHFNVYSPAYFSLSAPSQPGRYWVVAYATDGSREGSCYYPAWITVEGESSGASVNLSCPSYVETGRAYRVSATISAPAGSRVRVYVDGREIQDFLATISSWSTTVLFDTPGTHRITMDVVNGGVIASDSCTIYAYSSSGSSPRPSQVRGDIEITYCPSPVTAGEPFKVRGRSRFSISSPRPRNPTIIIKVDGEEVRRFDYTGTNSSWETTTVVNSRGNHRITAEFWYGSEFLDSDSCVVRVRPHLRLLFPNSVEGRNGEDLNICGEVENLGPEGVTVNVSVSGDFSTEHPTSLTIPAHSRVPLCVLIHIPPDRDSPGRMRVSVDGAHREVLVRVDYRAPSLLVIPRVITLEVEAHERTKIAEFRVANPWHLPQTVYISSSLPYSTLSIPAVTLAPGQEVTVEVWVDAPEGRYSGYVLFRTDYITSTHALSYRSERRGKTGGVGEEGGEDVRVYVWDQEVRTGEEIYVRVRNFGEETVVKRVRLVGIDLEDEDRTVILRGGESRKIGFEVADEPGEYTVTVLPWGKSFKVTVVGEEEEEEGEVTVEEEVGEEREWGRVEVTVQGKSGGEVWAEFQGAEGEIPIIEWEETPTGEAVGAYGSLFALLLGAFIVGMAYVLARV